MAKFILVLALFSCELVFASDSQAETMYEPRGSFAIRAEPLNLAIGQYRVGLQFPISKKLTLSPRYSVFREGTYGSRVGSQYGLRGQFHLASDWRLAGDLIKLGLFKNDWDGQTLQFTPEWEHAHSWKVDALYGHQWNIFAQIVSLDFSAGMEAYEIDAHYVTGNRKEVTQGLVLEGTVVIFL